MASTAMVYGSTTSLLQTMVSGMLSHDFRVPVAGSAYCCQPDSFLAGLDTIRTLGFVSLELMAELKGIEAWLSLVM